VLVPLVHRPLAQRAPSSMVFAHLCVRVQPDGMPQGKRVLILRKRVGVSLPPFPPFRHEVFDSAYSAVSERLHSAPRQALQH
jgi:hypothetical protein